MHYGACRCCAEPVLPIVAYCVCAYMHVRCCCCCQNMFLAVTNSLNPQSPFVLDKLFGWSDSAHFVDPESVLLFPLVPILSQKKPSSPSRSFFQICFHTASIPWSSKWSLFFMFSHHNPSAYVFFPIRVTCRFYAVFV